jgi:hypothetical protein
VANVKRTDNFGDLGIARNPIQSIKINSTEIAKALPETGRNRHAVAY